MHTTTTTRPGGDDRRRSSTGPVAATWVAGTGAFLLLAAAAVFIAVRWDRLPEAAKLALVGALTGGFLAGGRALRRNLPATGDVLFHLGALLLPVDLAGLGLRASVGWRSLLLSEGVLGVGVLGPLAAASGSVVLAWVAAASMVALALGVAAVSPLPAAVPLAAAGVAAHLLGRRRLAVAWSAVAAFAPVLGFAGTAVVTEGGVAGLGVLDALGLHATPWALLGCVAGAVVLAREARTRHDVALAGVALAGAVSGVVTTWAGAGISGETTALSVPVAFLVAQVVALLCEPDAFWRRLARPAADVAEVVAVVVGGLWTFGLVLAAPIVESGFDFLTDDPGWQPRPAAGASLAVLALAWLVAGVRHTSSSPARPGGAGALLAAAGHPRAAAWLGLAAVAAVEVATASGPATAGALVAVAAVLVRAGTPAAAAVGAGLALWAPVAAVGHPYVALAAGAAAALVLALAAAGGAGATAGAGERRSVALAAGAVLAGAAGTALAVPALRPSAALAAFVAQAWAVALVVDQRGGAGVAAHVGRAGVAAGAGVAAHVGRGGMAAGAGVALTLAPAAGVLPAALATALLAADAVRLRRPSVAVAAAATVQVVVGLLCAMAGLDAPETGLALVLAAVVWGGLAAVVDGEWRVPFLAAAGMGLVAGLGLAAGDGRTLSDALVVSGGLVVAAGVMSGRDAVAHAGGVAVTVGVLGHLGIAGVTALEPWVAPVAAHLVVAGWRGRRTRRLSSWVAYGPAVALLGGSALAERLDGGPAWHALLAGAVGVVAVAAGGWRRLAGPLFLGTALVVSVTLVESLGALAGVPTWGWLAAGGLLLLSVGVLLERADASPVDAGRRLVDVIAERFE